MHLRFYFVKSKPQGVHQALSGRLLPAPQGRENVCQIQNLAMHSNALRAPQPYIQVCDLDRHKRHLQAGAMKSETKSIIIILDLHVSLRPLL